MNKKTYQGLTIALALLLCNHAWALEEIMRNYRGVRSLGMGGVVTTTGRYDEALFGNPATAAENPETKISVLGITAEANDNLYSDSKKISDVKSASGSDVMVKISEKKLAGRNEHTRVSVLIGYYNPTLFGENTGFSFGLLFNTQANIMLRGNADIDAQAFMDMGPNFGVTHKFLDGALDTGINVHGIYRLASDQSLKATDFLAGRKLSLSSIGGQGIGLDADIGAYYKIPFQPPFFKSISVGGSLNNVAQSTYRIAGNDLLKAVKAAPPGNDRTGSLGVRADLPDFWILSENLFAVEFQDIGSTSRQASLAKKLHIGGETHVTKTISVRAGSNSGYLGGGFGFDLPIVKIDLATYGEELAANTGQLEDRRFVFRLAFEI